MSKYDVHLADLSPGVIEQEAKRRFTGDVGVTVLDRVDSTNTWMKQAVATSPLEAGRAAVCAAEHQTAGRGRRGKTWHSPTRGVTFTTAFSLPFAANRLSGLSLLVGVAVCTVLRGQGVADTRVKWPNDILVHGAKLCGVLIEVVNAKPDSVTVIAGIGVNYRRGGEARLIDQHSTDLDELCGGAIADRSLLIGALAGEVLNSCAGDVPDAVEQLASRWGTFDALENRLVECEGEAGKRFVGRALGIDASGCLLVDSTDGVCAVGSGSVRALQQE